MTRQIVVVTAGLSQPSSTRLLADQLAAAVTTAVTARGEAAAVEVIELRDLAQDLATTLVTGGLPTPSVARALDLVAAADALVAVTPVFGASYSGLFKMFIDVLGTEALNGVPVLIAATAGTARHSLVLDHAMRPLFSHLRAVVVPTGVYAATEDFGGAQGSDLTARIARAASELAALVTTGAGGGAVGGFVPSAADEVRPRASVMGMPQQVTPFAELLRGHAG
jgi:FMN reductase